MRFHNNSLVICELNDTNSRDGTGLWVEKLSEAFDLNLLPWHSLWYNCGEGDHRGLVGEGGRHVMT